MKIIKCLPVLLALCAFSNGAEQDNVQLGIFDWLIENCQGNILAISGDSLNFEEKWMHIVPNATIIAAEEGSEISLESLRAPCWVEISYFAKGKRLFVKALRFISQRECGEDGSIIGDHPEQTE